MKSLMLITVAIFLSACGSTQIKDVASLATMEVTDDGAWCGRVRGCECAAPHQVSLAQNHSSVAPYGYDVVDCALCGSE